MQGLSFLSKLTERAVASQFMAHSDSNHLLSPRQSAYRRRFSTETAVLLVYNDIIRAVDQGHLVAMALLDLSCAFDTVDHVTLLSILSQRFLVTDQALAWFQSYLTDRYQVYTTDSTQSAPIALTSGIPQGSGLNSYSIHCLYRGYYQYFPISQYPVPLVRR